MTASSPTSSEIQVHARMKPIYTYPPQNFFCTAEVCRLQEQQKFQVAMTTDPAALRGTGWALQTTTGVGQRLLQCWHCITRSTTTTSIWTAGDTVTPQPSELEARDKIELTDLVSLETAATGSQVITPVSHFYKPLFFGGRKVHFITKALVFQSDLLRFGV